jgi:hypothetical protein
VSSARVVALFDYIEAKADHLDAELRAEQQREERAELLLEELRLYRAAAARRQRRRDRRMLGGLGGP